MRSALFVDFDNVYSGLRRLDPAVADRFAHQPQAWIEWLTDSLPAPKYAPEGASRRLLVRRCYLNPQVYQRFRPAFNRAGFEIIDCPAMTSEGKTSTDIHMVLDIVDLLQHETRYDEFIVFSADADFTPVLRKLRRWDRRTTVLAVGFPSAAYQASADLLIDPDEFVRDGLGFEDPEEPPTPAPPARAQADIAREVTRFMRKAVADSAKPVALPWLASKAPAEVQRLDATNWAGFNSFRALVDSLKLAPLAVNWELGLILDPSRHVLRENANASAAGTAPEPADARRKNGVITASSDWGSNKKLEALVTQVRAATGTPPFSPIEIRFLLESLGADLLERPFLLTETGKRVRDKCREKGLSINRSDVSFVLKGILFGGHSFGQGNDDADSLGKKFVDSVLDLCRREQLLLDESQVGMLHTWVSQAAVGAR